MENENLEEFFSIVDGKKLSQKEFQNQLFQEAEQVKLELIKFTKAKLKKSEMINQIIQKAADILFERLNGDEFELEDISTNTLLNIIEKLSKLDIDMLGTLLNKSQQNQHVINIDATTGQVIQNNESEMQIDKDTYQTVKKIINFLETLEKNKEEEVN